MKKVHSEYCRPIENVNYARFSTEFVTHTYSTSDFCSVLFVLIYKPMDLRRHYTPCFVNLSNKWTLYVHYIAISVQQLDGTCYLFCTICFTYSRKYNETADCVHPFQRTLRPYLTIAIFCSHPVSYTVRNSLQLCFLIFKLIIFLFAQIRVNHIPVQLNS